MKENIIQRNFFRLLRSGAFDDKSAIEPMSAFKWRHLYQMMDTQNVIPYFVEGINNHKHDHGLNLPQDLIDNLKKYLQEQVVKTATNRQQTVEEKDFTNFFLRRKYRNIIEKELHSIDTSTETIQLLKILVYNQWAMLNQGMSMDGIIRLGKYLRQRGDKVDFVKLDNWLAALQLRNMAKLQGSVLATVFDFEPDELPFAGTIDRHSRQLVLIAVSHIAKDTAEEWHFRLTTTGFVRNNSTILWRNMKRSIRYISYAPVETISSFFVNFGRSFSEIEE